MSPHPVRRPAATNPLAIALEALASQDRRIAVLEAQVRSLQLAMPLGIGHVPDDAKRQGAKR